MTTSYSYVGGELALFANATNWKRYFRSRIKPFIRGDVLEVGAGIGGTTALLSTAPHRSWFCLEPDATLAAQLEQRAASHELPVEPHVHRGFVADLPDEPRFDTALYIDVLEHIEHDREELSQVARRIRPGGHVIVLAPAHNWLFSEFDRAVGHFRRYDEPMLRDLTPQSLTVTDAFYLDSLGVMLSFGNRFKKSSLPTAGQIALWDKAVVPCSRLLDPLVRRRFGKTVIVVYGRPLPA